MAKQITVTTEYTDDIDGSVALGTINFSYLGTNYEIDLSRTNSRAFERAMKPYVDAARKVSTTRGGRARRTNARVDLAAVRSWANEQGYAVSARGRIAGSVVDAYRAAH